MEQMIRIRGLNWPLWQLRARAGLFPKSWEPRAAAGKPRPSPPQWQAHTEGWWWQTGPMGGPAIVRWRQGNWPTQGQASKPSQPSGLMAGAGVPGMWDRPGQEAHPGQGWNGPGQRIHGDAPGKAEISHADWFPHTGPWQSVTSVVAETSRHVTSFIKLRTSNFWARYGFLYLFLMKSINYQYILQTSEFV